MVDGRESKKRQEKFFGVFLFQGLQFIDVLTKN